MRRLGCLVALLLAVGCVTIPARPAQAVVTSPSNSVEYSPAVPTTTFSVPFSFGAASHITVVKTLIATNTPTTLVQGVDYTVEVPIGATLGSVKTMAAVTNTHRLKITRVVPFGQLVSFISQGKFLPFDLEWSLDRLWEYISQLPQNAVTGGDVTAAIATHEGAADPHTGYLRLAGRAGGQSANGGTGSGENLQLASTTHGTKGKILFGALGLSAFDEVNGRWGFGTNAPSYLGDFNGTVRLNSVLVDGGNVYKTASNGVLGLFGDTSGVNRAAVAIYGTTHATNANQVQLLCATCFVYSNTGTLRWTFDSTGIIGAAGLDIDLNGDLFVTTDTGYDVELDSWTLGHQSSANDAEFAIYSSQVFGLASGAGINIYGELHATKSADIDVVGDLILLRDTWGTTESSALVAIDVNGVRIKTGALQQWRREKQTAAIAETVVVPDDCGDVFWASTDNTVVQLPDITADSAGCEITLKNSGNDLAALISLSPHASDGIEGSCIGTTGAGAATLINFSGTVNKDIQNTKSTAQKGDTVTVISDGVSAWYTDRCYGQWASEP